MTMAGVRSHFDDGNWGIPIMFGLTLAGYPLAASIPIVFGLPSRLISVPFRGLVLGLAIFLLLREFMKKSTTAPKWFLAGVYFFWLFFLYRLFSNTVIMPISLHSPPGEYWITAIGITILPALVFLIPMSGETLRRAYRLSFFAVSLAVIATLVAWRSALGSGGLGLLTTDRLGTDTFGAIQLGHLGATLSLLGFYQIVVWSSGEGNDRSWLAWPAILVGLALVVFSGSRGPVLAFAVAAISLVIFSGRDKGGAKLGKIWLLIMACGGIYLFIEFFLGVDFRAISRILRLFSGEFDTSMMSRLTLYTNAMSEIAQHPLLGSAIEEPTAMFRPHNVILEAYMATGLIAGTVFLSIYGCGFVMALRLISKDIYGGWIGLLCIQYQLGALFSGSIYGSYRMWALLFGVAAIFGQSRHREGVSEFISS